MGRKVLVVLGSPRKNGNSAALAERLAAGARDAGAKVETIRLQGMDIRPCTGCEKCQKDPEKGCNIRDDMQGLYPRIRASDAIAIAGPVYWFSLNAQTKTFIDRWYALIGREGALSGKRMALLLSYADADPMSSGAVNAIRTFQDICRYLDAEIAGMVYGSANAPGEIRGNRGLLGQAYRLGKALAC